jgi:hypothetical protein
MLTHESFGLLAGLVAKTSKTNPEPKAADCAQSRGLMGQPRPVLRPGAAVGYHVIRAGPGLQPVAGQFTAVRRCLALPAAAAVLAVIPWIKQLLALDRARLNEPSPLRTGFFNL